MIDDAEANLFLPAAPEPSFTLPTTTYKTKRAFPRNLLPADYYRVGQEHAHLPLVVMLVFTQLSVGAFLAGLCLERLLGAAVVAPWRTTHATVALVCGLLALAASTLHLGRPHLAFRAMVGLRHSWLSREILGFGLFAGLAMAYWGAMVWIAPLVGERVVSLLGIAVGLSGLAGIFCSAMIYAFTRREFWSLPRSLTLFALTSAVLGVAAVWGSLLVAAMLNPDAKLMELLHQAGPALCQSLIVVTAVKLLLEASFFRHLASRQMHSRKRSALLMAGELSSVALARFAAGLLGGIVMPSFLLANKLVGATALTDPATLLTLALSFVACLLGESLERYLFFAAVAPPRMPGGIRS